jgi:hypothetical protein
MLSGFRRFGAIISVALLSGPALSQQIPQADAILFEAADVLHSVAVTAKPRQERLRAANLVSRYCNTKLRLIPKLSPREEDWLRGELRGGMDRQIRAKLSREGKLFDANAKFMQCVNISDAIRAATATDTERVLWAQLVTLFVVVDIQAEFADINEAAQLKVFGELEAARVSGLVSNIISNIFGKILE